MNRVIKFRAWDTTIKKMWQQELSNLPISDFGRNDLNFMQFTGLLDKSGKEIYELDRVKYMDDEYTVKWSDVNAGFWVDGIHGLNKAVADDCEVIGNIFTSPELLNE